MQSIRRLEARLEVSAWSPHLEPGVELFRRYMSQRTDVFLRVWNCYLRLRDSREMWQGECQPIQWLFLSRLVQAYPGKICSKFYVIGYIIHNYMYTPPDSLKKIIYRIHVYRKGKGTRKEWMGPCSTVSSQWRSPSVWWCRSCSLFIRPRLALDDRLWNNGNIVGLAVIVFIA